MQANADGNVSSWLSLRSSTLTASQPQLLQPGTETNVSVLVSLPSAFAFGVYTSTVAVYSNDPARPVVLLRVHLRVAALRFLPSAPVLVLGSGDVPSAGSGASIIAVSLLEQRTTATVQLQPHGQGGRFGECLAAQCMLVRNGSPLNSTAAGELVFSSIGALQCFSIVPRDSSALVLSRCAGESPRGNDTSAHQLQLRVRVLSSMGLLDSISISVHVQTQAGRCSTSPCVWRCRQVHGAA